MQMRLIFMLLTLILLSCAYRDMQLPERTPSTKNASHVNIIRESRVFSFGFPLKVMFDDTAICSLQAGEYVRITKKGG